MPIALQNTPNPNPPATAPSTPSRSKRKAGALDGTNIPSADDFQTPPRAPVPSTPTKSSTDLLKVKNVFAAFGMQTPHRYGNTPMKDGLKDLDMLGPSPKTPRIESSPPNSPSTERTSRNSKPKAGVQKQSGEKQSVQEKSKLGPLLKQQHS